MRIQPDMTISINTVETSSILPHYVKNVLSDISNQAGYESCHGDFFITIR
jgi:hypothetical protein